MPCPPGLYALVGAGPLFIIPKLFIYFRGLSDPFLSSRTGWVRAAGWGACPGHPPHFRLTLQSQAWPGFSLTCLHPAALGHGAWNTGRVGSTGVFSSPDRPAHNPPARLPALGTWSYRWREPYPCHVRHSGGFSQCVMTQRTTHCPIPWSLIYVLPSRAP